MTQLLIRLFVRHPDDTKNAAVRTPTAIWPASWAWPAISCSVWASWRRGRCSAPSHHGRRLNNLSDASSNVVSLVGFRLAAKGPDEKHPYGHARYEYLAGLVVCVTILAIGLRC